eukprot:1157614-Pelagomonas_calceolata.AAC.5
MPAHELPVFIEGQSIPTCTIATSQGKQSLLSTCQQISAFHGQLSSQPSRLVQLHAKDADVTTNPSMLLA